MFFWLATRNAVWPLANAPVATSRCKPHCSYNPEPVAEFFDMFYIGEGETVYDQLLDLYKEMKAAGKSRREFLIEAARQVPGIYVPSLYEVRYKPDGTIASFGPAVPGVPEKILKQTVKDLDAAPYPLHQLVPFIQITQDRAVVEIQRGCIRGCRFCQAGMIYRPNREKSLDLLKRYTDELIDNTGFDDFTLSSLSSSDYTCIKELVNYIVDTYGPRGTSLQGYTLLVWTRSEAFDETLIELAQKGVKIRLVFMDENGIYLDAGINDGSIPELSAQVVKQEICTMTAFMDKVINRYKALSPNGKGSIEYIKVKYNLVTSQIVIADDRAYITPYMSFFNTPHCPLYKIQNNRSDLYRKYLMEFNRMWNEETKKKNNELTKRGNTPSENMSQQPGTEGNPSLENTSQEPKADGDPPLKNTSQEPHVE